MDLPADRVPDVGATISGASMLASDMLCVGTSSSEEALGAKMEQEVMNQPFSAKPQNGYCLTFDLSIAIQPEPARPCGVPGIAFKLR
jgi:hypothetical protein